MNRRLAQSQDRQSLFSNTNKVYFYKLKSSLLRWKESDLHKKMIN